MTMTTGTAYNGSSINGSPTTNANHRLPQALPSGGAQVYGCFTDNARSETHLSLFPFVLGMEAICGRPMALEGPLVGGPAVRGWPPVPPCCPTCRSELFARRYR
jgi:hypothetical protein